MQGFWTLLSENEHDMLSGLGLPRDYPVGATLCLEGDPATHVFILRAGWVKILSATKDGHEMLLALRGDGDIVGEVAGETTGRRNATIQAVDAVQALIVRHDKFSSFLDSHQGADRAYRRVVTQKWNDTDTILRLRTGTTGAQRLAGLLVDLAERHGRTVNGVIYLRLAIDAGGTGQPGWHIACHSYARARATGENAPDPHGSAPDHDLDLTGLQRVAGRQS